MEHGSPKKLLMHMITSINQEMPIVPKFGRMITLLGGLYGIRLGKCFFGESMFSHVSNASKYAFIKYVQLLQAEGVQINRLPGLY